jgi:hypothetical protein
MWNRETLPIEITIFIEKLLRGCGEDVSLHERVTIFNGFLLGDRVTIFIEKLLRELWRGAYPPHPTP